jgi:hypothetical protein
MEDSKVAKLLISSIIGQDVELIGFSPKYLISELPDQSKIKGNSIFTI